MHLLAEGSQRLGPSLAVLDVPFGPPAGVPEQQVLQQQAQRPPSHPANTAALEEHPLVDTAHVCHHNEDFKVE